MGWPLDSNIARLVLECSKLKNIWEGKYLQKEDLRSP
jgi:hypothetical protein